LRRSRKWDRPRTPSLSANRCAALVMEERTGVPFTGVDRLIGLAPGDDLMALLTRVSGMPVPGKYRRQRSQLLDAMLDGHFHFGGKKIALGAEPDLLWSIARFLTEMGGQICAAVTTTLSPVLERMPVEQVVIGDLEDLENLSVGCDLLLTNSHGRQAAERLHVPFYRLGFPMFDRLGAAHRVSVGYRGTRDLIFDIGNVFMANTKEPRPDTWRHTEAPLAHTSSIPAPEELVTITELT